MNNWFEKLNYLLQATYESAYACTYSQRVTLSQSSVWHCHKQACDIVTNKRVTLSQTSVWHCHKQACDIATNKRVTLSQTSVWHCHNQACDIVTNTLDCKLRLYCLRVTTHVWCGGKSNACSCSSWRGGPSGIVFDSVTLRTYRSPLVRKPEGHEFGVAEVPHPLREQGPPLWEVTENWCLVSSEGRFCSVLPTWPRNTSHDQMSRTSGRQSVTGHCGIRVWATTYRGSVSMLE
jgi:hypothetical protein